MEPSVNPGDYLFVSKFRYDFMAPQRGDLIVFHARKYRTDFIKRIVGLPGDRIQMKGGRLFINGVEARQRRIADWVEKCETTESCRVPQYEESLPGGRLVRVLDRIANGPEDNSEMFIVPAGDYFVLGDNRDNSDDSRDSIGFVAGDEIVGRAAYKFIAAGSWTWRSID